VTVSEESVWGGVSGWVRWGSWGVEGVREDAGGKEVGVLCGLCLGM